MSYRALLIVFLATSCFAEEQEKDSAAERREALAFQAVGEMISNRDELLKRYAVVLEGETSEFDEQVPSVVPRLIIRCESVEHKYQYAAQVDFRSGVEFDEAVSLTTRQRSEWQERVTFKGDVKVFRGEKKLGATFMEVGKGPIARDAMQKLGLAIPEFEPFDDFVGYSTGMIGRYPYPGALEDLFLHRGKLLFTEAGEKGWG